MTKVTTALLLSLALALLPGTARAQRAPFPERPGIERWERPEGRPTRFRPWERPTSPMAVWEPPPLVPLPQRGPSIGMPRGADGEVLPPPRPANDNDGAPYPTPGLVPGARLRDMREGVSGVSRVGPPLLTAEQADQIWPGRGATWDARGQVPCPGGAACREIQVRRRSIDPPGEPRVDGVAVWCRQGAACRAEPRTVQVDVQSRERGRPTTRVTIFPEPSEYVVGHSEGPPPSQAARFGMQRLGGHMLDLASNPPGSQHARDMLREGVRSDREEVMQRTSDPNFPPPRRR